MNQNNELGLFVGAIGKERSFLMKPRDQELRLPTDLLGITPADYVSSRSDGDLVSGTNRACSLIKKEVDSLGLIDHASLSDTNRLRANPVQYSLFNNDFRFLNICLKSYAEHPQGLYFHEINSEFRSSQDFVELSAIKLERMGLIEKFVVTHPQSEEDYYSYRITELGIDTLFKNDGGLVQKAPTDISQP